ncbi:HlyD family efflux transporter periplasmic adaptor subunit [Sphingomonas sp. 28-63-12]|uniref:HlyD family efflux transporter periplasmic adaptor subunit n=1 Tax=Sphingomonas sp. 28-63-12 TaxID=1970434 RepID=UPI000BDA1782|nr:MAG: secretion protein HlyD [Sphingomonas sp. 28-63-12]
MNVRRLIGIAALIALMVAGLATRGFGAFTPADKGLALYGNVDVRQVELGFRVPGRIASMAVDEGAKVPPGTVLAQLDPRPLRDSVAVADAQIAQADAELAKREAGNRTQDIAQAQAVLAERQAALDKAQQDDARRQSLVASGAVSQALADATRADLRAAQARLRAAQQMLSLQQAGSRREDIRAARAQRASAIASRDRARTDLADAVIVAPEGGTVLTRAREPGAIVQAGETVFTLTIDRPLRVRAYIAEPDIGRIAPGMAVQVTADGNNRTYHGTIGFISPTAEFTPKSVQTESLRTDLVYRLRINVSDPDDALRQGQPVSIAVPTARTAGRR